MSSRYVVHFREDTTVSVEVDAASVDDAIAAAYNALPGSLCHQCTGHGAWSRDTGDYETLIVTDASGAEVWTATDESKESDA